MNPSVGRRRARWGALANLHRWRVLWTGDERCRPDCPRGDGVRRLPRSRGLAPDPEMRMPFRHLHMCFTPPRWDGDDVPRPAHTRFLRHVSALRPGVELPDGVATLPDRPTVRACLGTVVNETPGVLEAVIDGLRDEPLNLIVVFGEFEDPARFGPPASERSPRALPVSAKAAAVWRPADHPRRVQQRQGSARRSRPHGGGPDYGRPTLQRRPLRGTRRGSSRRSRFPHAQRDPGLSSYRARGPHL
jgi:hypothetical protein